MKSGIFFTIVFSLFLNIANVAFAQESVEKTNIPVQAYRQLSVKPGYAYLLVFDDKIIRYVSGNDKALDIELVTSIFDNNKEMLIKPVSDQGTNLIVWTKSGVYNFDISSGKNVDDIPKIINFTHNSEDLSDLENFTLDKPPAPEQDNTYNFEIDKPPYGLKKKG